MKKYLIYIVFLSFLIAGCSEDNVTNNSSTNPSPSATTMDAKYASDWVRTLYRIMSDQQPNPQKCSRTFSYVCVGMYEAVRNGIPNSRSLSGQLNDMPQMPSIVQDSIYDWPIVLAATSQKLTIEVIDTLFTSSEVLVNDMYNTQYNERLAIVGQSVAERSSAYGIAIADKILEWSSTDKYTETRSMVYIIPPRSQNRAFWEPLNPGDRPTEPFWGMIRTMAIPDLQSCIVPFTDRFDSIPGNIYYDEALEVSNIAANLTEEQKNIAVYWNDKIRTGTPPGHWMMIGAGLVSDKNLKLDRAVELYCKLGITVRDCGIVAWKEKYDKNLLRPESYIRDWIRNDFYAYIQTPPFPEYPSGHSTFSGGAAEILTQFFGSIPFTDRTHIPIGYGERTYNNFYEARDEAGMSRLYGGIHFMHANTNGKTMGKMVAQALLSRIHFSWIN